MNCTLFHVKNYAGSVKDFISNLGKMNIFISNITTIQRHCVLPSNNPTNLTVLDNNDISDFTLIIGYNYGATIYSSTTTTIDKLAEDVLSISFTVVILKRQPDQTKSCTDGTVSTGVAEGYPMSTRPSGGLAYVFVDQPKRDAYLQVYTTQKSSKTDNQEQLVVLYEERSLEEITSAYIMNSESSSVKVR